MEPVCGWSRRGVADFRSGVGWGAVGFSPSYPLCSVRGDLSFVACSIWSLVVAKSTWNVLLLTLKFVIFCVEVVDLHKLLIIFYKFLGRNH